MQAIIIAAIAVGGTGLLIGLLLGMAEKKFYVPVDEREQLIRAALPGANCGGCGFTGCDALAEAIASGTAPSTGCPVGGDQTAAAIAEILGEEVDGSEPMVAFVRCQGSREKTKQIYDYYGIDDCKMVSMIPSGGPKSCDYGCLGYGSCVKVCPFDAIHIIDGIAKVDATACKACKKCIQECPKQLIELVPKLARSKVACRSLDRGKEVMDACQVGCIACKKCQKVCPVGAITVDNNIAYVNQALCTGCGRCQQACPRGIICF